MLKGVNLKSSRDSRHLLRAYRLVIIELHRDLLGSEGVAACRHILTSVGLRSSAVVKSVEAWIRPDLFVDLHDKVRASESTFDSAAYLGSYI